MVSAGLSTLETNFSSGPTPSLFSKTRQEEEKPGDAIRSELKMLDMGEDPASDGDRMGIPLPQFSKPSKTPTGDLMPIQCFIKHSLIGGERRVSPHHRRARARARVYEEERCEVPDLSSEGWPVRRGLGRPVRRTRGSVPGAHCSWVPQEM